MSAGVPPGSRPDPNVTQPFPTVGRGGSPAGPPPRPGRAPRTPRPPSAPSYGNLLAYLLARLAAFVVDVPGLAFFATAFVYGQLRLDTRATATVGQASYGFIATASLVGALVFAMLCEGTIGTTLGKGLFMLHVHRARGGYAGFGRAIVRALLRPLDLLLVGPLLATVTPRHQRLGDFAAGTTVARSPAGVAAPLVAVVLLAGLGYADYAYGGGLDSAIGVAAVTSGYVPAWRDEAMGVLGFVVPALRRPSDTVPVVSTTSSPEPGSAAPAPETTFPPGDETTPAPAPTPETEPESPAASPGAAGGATPA